MKYTVYVWSDSECPGFLFKRLIHAAKKDLVFKKELHMASDKASVHMRVLAMRNASGYKQLGELISYWKIIWKITEL